MNRRAAIELLLAAPAVLAQDAKTPPVAGPVVGTATDPSQDYVCPMDPDMRSNKPGACPRCGMKLVLGIPDGTEYLMEMTVTPKIFRPGQKVELAFRVRDPRTGKLVERFEVVHEKLFHMFIVSQDLGSFVHDHPRLGADHVFRFEAVFPKPGLYRILGDVYPSGGTPQLIATTLVTPAGPGERPMLRAARLTPDLAVKSAANMDVELAMEPAQPISGLKTMMFFKLKPAEGLQKYLGAWGHMLAASDDLVDLIHTHPFLADGGAQEQFNLIFPRARTYRVWVQFQRQGVVNTAAFTIPVSELK